jgi:hypothetical protein
LDTIRARATPIATIISLATSRHRSARDVEPDCRSTGDTVVDGVEREARLRRGAAAPRASPPMRAFGARGAGLLGGLGFRLAIRDCLLAP